MIIQFHNILTPGELTAIRTELESSEFVSGKETASGRAAEVKDNLPLDPSQSESRKVMPIVLNALVGSGPFYRAAYSISEINSSNFPPLLRASDG